LVQMALRRTLLQFHRLPLLAILDVLVVSIRLLGVHVPLILSDVFGLSHSSWRRPR
jgi:hypothetical protein